MGERAGFGGQDQKPLILVVGADPGVTVEGDSYRDRYQAMLGRSAEGDERRWVFPLRIGSVELIPVSVMAEVPPGETAPVLPFFAAHAVAVSDVAAARSLTESNGITTHELPDGFFVSARDAYGQLEPVSASAGR